MTAKCVFNTGKALLGLQRVPIGITADTQYGELEVGRVYLIMGMMLFDGHLTYLIDSGRIVNACYQQLFTIIDGRFPPNWHFRAFARSDNYRQVLEAVWGYPELVFDESHYAKLVDMEEDAQRIYFRRKMEMEKNGNSDY